MITRCYEAMTIYDNNGNKHDQLLIIWKPMDEKVLHKHNEQKRRTTTKVLKKRWLVYLFTSTCSTYAPLFYYFYLNY